MGAYTPSDNVIRNEVESALGLSLSHLQRNVPLVLIVNCILILKIDIEMFPLY